MITRLQESIPAFAEHTPAEGTWQSSIQCHGQELPAEGAATWQDQSTGELDA